MASRKLNPTDHELTGPWAGFRFCQGLLVSPEGHEFDPESLKWLSLTCAIRREWTLMRDEARAARRPARDPALVYMRDVLAGARDRLRRA